MAASSLSKVHAFSLSTLDKSLVIDNSLNDIDLIRLHYGFAMAKFCKTCFPTILNNQGLLFKLLSDHFEYSQLLYKDIKDNSLESGFIEYMKSLYLKTNNSSFNIPGYVIDDFGKYYKIKPGYIKASDGNYYKCNYEYNGYYFCHNNVVLEPDCIKKYDPRKYVLFDCFIYKKVGDNGIALKPREQIVHKYNKSIVHPDEELIKKAYVQRVMTAAGKTFIFLNTGVKIIIDDNNHILAVEPTIAKEPSGTVR